MSERDQVAAELRELAGQWLQLELRIALKSGGGIWFGFKQWLFKRQSAAAFRFAAYHVEWKGTDHA